MLTIEGQICSEPKFISGKNKKGEYEFTKFQILSNYGKFSRIENITVFGKKNEYLNGETVSLPVSPQVQLYNGVAVLGFTVVE